MTATGAGASDLDVRVAVYDHFARHAEAPAVATIAARVGLPNERVLAAYGRLREERTLVVDEEGAIVMAPPFSGVPTQHVAQVDGRRYFANCAWDVLGVIAALGRPGLVHSRCEQSREPLRLAVGESGVEASSWLFHCLVPAVAWWDDIVHT